jgi:hypothetical protein
LAHVLNKLYTADRQYVLIHICINKEVCEAVAGLESSMSSKRQHTILCKDYGDTQEDEAARVPVPHNSRINEWRIHSTHTYFYFKRVV